MTAKTVIMRAYCGDAVFEASVRCTKQGINRFRQDVQEALFIETPKVGEPIIHPLLISIPGGRA